MAVITFLQAPVIEKIVREQALVNKQKARTGYNLFSISGYTSHLENFHGDVIASLLDPEGLHGEGYKFLHLFIDFLQNSHAVSVNKADYI